MKSAYSTMWTSVYFHLPTDCKEAKAAARKFIAKVRGLDGRANVVIRNGNGAGLILCDYEKAVAELSAALPPDGELRLVPVTDKQVENSRNFWGQRRTVSAK